MGNSSTEVERGGLKLSCRETYLILRVVSPQKKYEAMTKEEYSAIEHYARCEGCREAGLDQILETKPTCQSIILRWAKNACALWLNHGEALIDEQAVEHVWGKYLKNSIGGYGFDFKTACHERPCLSLHSYWSGVSMSSHSDGPGGPIHLFPCLFDIFLTEGWPLDELFSIQRRRVAELSEDIKSGKIRPSTSGGHYNSIRNLCGSSMSMSKPCRSS